MADVNPFALLDEEEEAVSTKEETLERKKEATKEIRNKTVQDIPRKENKEGNNVVAGPVKKDSKNRGHSKTGFTRKRDFDRSAKGKGEKRGGAGKANWGAPGDEAKEGDAEKTEEGAEEPAVEEEEEQITLEDHEKRLQEMKSSLNASVGKPTEVDMAAFEGLAVFEKKDENDNNPLVLSNAKVPKGKSRSKPLKEKETLVPNFKIEDKSYVPREKRQPGAGRGNGRSAGRGSGRGGRGGERSNRSQNSVVSPPIHDVAAFPTLGA